MKDSYPSYEAFFVLMKCLVSFCYPPGCCKQASVISPLCPLGGALLSGTLHTLWRGSWWCVCGLLWQHCDAVCSAKFCTVIPTCPSHSVIPRSQRLLLLRVITQEGSFLKQLNPFPFFSSATVNKQLATPPCFTVNFAQALQTFVAANSKCAHFPYRAY